MLWCLIASITAICLLSGIAHTDLTKLQLVQNRLACACVVTKSQPFTRSVPLLHSLKWLPVKFCVDFKICFLTYIILREKQPVYLHSTLSTSLPSRSLRSSNGITLLVPGVKINTNACAFHCCAFSLWHNLPLYFLSATSTVIFRKHLKTHVFGLAFPP